MYTNVSEKHVVSIFIVKTEKGSFSEMLILTYQTVELVIHMCTVFLHMLDTFTFVKPLKQFLVHHSTYS
jgi:hypothetical protein